MRPLLLVSMPSVLFPLREYRSTENAVCISCDVVHLQPTLAAATRWQWWSKMQWQSTRRWYCSSSSVMVGLVILDRVFAILRDTEHCEVLECVTLYRWSHLVALLIVIVPAWSDYVRESDKAGVFCSWILLTSEISTGRVSLSRPGVPGAPQATGTIYICVPSNIHNCICVYDSCRKVYEVNTGFLHHSREARWPPGICEVSDYLNLFSSCCNSCIVDEWRHKRSKIC